MATLSPQQFYANNKIEEFYLFYGNETYLIHDAVHRVHHKLFGTEELKPSENLSLEIYYGTDRSPQTILDSVQSLGFFSTQKLILIRDADGFREKDFNILSKTVESVLSGTTLIFAIDGALPRNKFFKSVAAKGLAVEFKTPYERDFPQWINYLAQKNNLTLTPQGIGYIYQILGSNLSLIDNELKKVSLNKGVNAKITVEDLQTIMASGKEESVFHFTSAYGNRDLNQCVSLLHSLLEQGQSAVSIVSLLARHLRILMQISLSSSRDPQNLSSQLGIPSFFVRDYLKQIGQWSKEDIKSAIQALRASELNLKSIATPSKLVLENFLLLTL